MQVRAPGSWIAALVLIVAVGAAWAHSLGAPFVFDDHASILDNTSIRHLWPPDWLHAPSTSGETVSGRPFLNFTLAVNWAISRHDVAPYRVTNLLIHAAAALILMGLVRRTLARVAPHAETTPFAMLVSVAWAVHPLQTASVTYVIQRAESLAGFFLLLTLYCFVRATDGGPRRTWWSVACVIACTLGLATKETMAVAPVLVLLYDRAFVAGSFTAAWRARSRLHIALAATWLLLAALVLAQPGRGGSAGWNAAITPWAYALTQCAAIVHYLRLAVWPSGLVFDYGTPVVTDPALVLPQFFMLAALIGATVWALVRNRPIGFVGAFFFLVLAPSSSVVPIATQTIAEHRVYLALVPLILLVGGALGVAGRRVTAPRFALSASLLVIVALSAVTRARNEVYLSEERLWRDTSRKVPDNPRAHYNLGLTLAMERRPKEAAAEFHRALELQPGHAFAHFELGKADLLSGRWTEAAAWFGNAVQADPHYVDARVNLAQALVRLGREKEAITQYRQALAYEPGAPDIRTNLAAVLIQRGEVAPGTALVREAIAIAPEYAEAHYQLGLALTRSGDTHGAETEFQTAVRLKPSFAEAQHALAVGMAAQGKLAAAESACREAVRLDDRSAEAWFVLGNVLAQQRRLPEAMDAFQSALRLEAGHVPALNNLANCQLITGRLASAIANYEAVLRLRPGDTSVQESLRIARELQARSGGQP